MNIEKELKNEGIEVITELDTSLSNSIAKNVARRISESFTNLDISENDLFDKLLKLKMYKAKMIEGMAEANYFYKNTSIYFNEHIDNSDLEEFAIHECIHYIQEKKDDKNILLRMGLCNYKNKNSIGLGLNEAAVQYLSSIIIGIDPDYEKYYDISLYTPSPSYYPLECALLNEILYFTDKDVLIKSTLLSTDDFKDLVISKTSENTYNTLLKNFDKIINLEEKIIKLNFKINMFEDGNSRIEKLMSKSENLKSQIAEYFIKTQKIIIKEFFDSEYKKITNLEEIDIFRRKLYKFSDIIGSVKNYKYFDNYYVETMNKLEHKNNILENGGIETALATSGHSFFSIFRKLFYKIFNKSTQYEEQ